MYPGSARPGQSPSHAVKGEAFRKDERMELLPRYDGEAHEPLSEAERFVQWQDFLLTISLKAFVAPGPILFGDDPENVNAFWEE